MTKSIIVLFSLLALSACGYINAAAMRDATDKGAAACRAAHPTPGSTYLERAKCLNDVELKVTREFNHPHMDLIYLRTAYRSALARRIDSGELTHENAQIEFGELTIRLRTEVRQRNAMAAMAEQARSARMQSTGALLQGLGVWNESLKPVPYRGPITCTHSWNTTTCF